MQVNQDSNPAKYQIQSYNTSGPHKGITINNIFYTDSILIHDNQLTQWRPHCFNDLQLEDFKTILDKPPRILLLGTGETAHTPSMALLRPLFEKGIGIEFMNTGAAIRTYSVLTSENRDTSLALII